MRRALAIAAVLLAGGATACGGSAPARSAASQTSESPSSTTSRSVLPQRPVSGAVVFARDCSACHSLIGNESLHRQGGDLLGYTLTRPQLLEQTRQMPVRHPLSAAELNAVVDYVEGMEQRARRSTG